MNQDLMRGHMIVEGRTLHRAGFMQPNLGAQGLQVGPSIPIIARGEKPTIPANLVERMEQLERGEFTGDLKMIVAQLGTTLNELQRGIVSTMTAFPVRENLEAPARILVPMDTPLRNRLKRTVGSGKASAWKQLTSLGGGWSGVDQPGSGGAIRMFFAENGAPAAHTSVYADKSAGYKLLGTYGDVTGFSMAAGANFQNQLATEKTNAILNLMLNEEHALTNADDASTAAPWGDGTTALAFKGMTNLITTANGVPAAQIQTTVGALTTAHIDAQLKRQFDQGARNPWMLMNGQEIMSLVHLAEASGSIIRVKATALNDTVIGVAVTGYKHPITGEIVPILASRFLAAGTILFCADNLPDGTPAIDVNVLPQVELPELAPDMNIQGYTAQELAPTTAAPQVYPFIVSVYETVRMFGATVFGKSTGVTAV